MLDDKNKNQNTNSGSQDSDLQNQTGNISDDQRSKGGSMTGGDFQNEPGNTQNNEDLESIDNE